MQDESMIELEEKSVEELEEHYRQVAQQAMKDAKENDNGVRKPKPEPQDDRDCYNRRQRRRIAQYRGDSQTMSTKTASSKRAQQKRSRRQNRGKK